MRVKIGSVVIRAGYDSNFTPTGKHKRWVIENGENSYAIFVAKEIVVSVRGKDIHANRIKYERASRAA